MSDIVERLKGLADEHYEMLRDIHKPLLEAAAEIERLRTLVEWRRTKDALPTKPGLADYEHVDCLIFYNGEIKFRPWNCEHQVWDQDDYDDFFCDPLEPTHWLPLPFPPETKE